MAQLEKWRQVLGLTLVLLAPAAWTLASADVASLTGDVATLSSDQLAGRVTGTAGSELALSHILTRLAQAGYGGRISTQAIAGGGTNILALLPGKGLLVSEYVLIGAHYDHVPFDARCTPKGDGGDLICNGATDNAAGIAILLDIAEQLAKSPPASRRGVYFAFWDREETDLGGSVAHRNATWPPFWPQPVAYVNYDIQGANLVPSLRTTTFAIGASSGGTRLASAVTSAAASEGDQLRLRHLTEVFGQYRSDYASFLAPKVVNKINPNLPAWLPRVPSVFFSDSNGPCYHTTQDELGVVDLQKLARQARTGLRLVRDLATGTKPSIQALPVEATTFGSLVGPFAGLSAPYPPIPPPTYADAVELLDVARIARADSALAPAAQTAIDAQLPGLEAVVSRGKAAYRPLIDGATVALAALTAIPALQSGECSGFLEGG